MKGWIGTAIVASVLVLAGPSKRPVQPRPPMSARVIAGTIATAIGHTTGPITTRGLITTGLIPTTRRHRSRSASGLDRSGDERRVSRPLSWP